MLAYLNEAGFLLPRSATPSRHRTIGPSTHASAHRSEGKELQRHRTTTTPTAIRRLPTSNSLGGALLPAPLLLHPNRTRTTDPVGVQKNPIPGMVDRSPTCRHFEPNCLGQADLETSTQGQAPLHKCSSL